MSMNISVLQKWLRDRNFCRAELQVKSSQIRTVQCRPSLALKSVQRLHITCNNAFKQWAPDAQMRSWTIAHTHTQKKKKANVQKSKWKHFKKKERNQYSSVRDSSAKVISRLISSTFLSPKNTKVINNSHSLLFTLMHSRCDTKQKARQ